MSSIRVGVFQASKAGRELIGPVKGSPKKEKTFRVEEFDISIAQRRAICLAGHKSQTCCRITNYYQGETMYRFRPGEPDAAIAHYGRSAPGSARVVKWWSASTTTIPQRRRRDMGTKAFQREARNRNAIEVTISELVRGYGLRKTRYRGLAIGKLFHRSGLQCAPLRAADRLGGGQDWAKPLDGAKVSVLAGSNLNPQSREHLKASHC